ncbi:MAG: hypothetical protein QGF23_03300 [Dehalococcoidales bacterium]|nr:hypothetical protein [Dehalococcoidales bacterium]
MVSRIAINLACKMEVEEVGAVAISGYKSKIYYLYAVGCKKAFDQNQERYLTKEK